MKIALVTNNYRPYAGGVVSSIDTLAGQLVKLGHQVYIVTLDFEGLGNSYDGQIAIIRVFCPLRFVYKTNHIAIPWFPNQAIRRILAGIRPDIIHSHHPFLLGVSALKAGEKLGIPVVFTYHSQYEKFAYHVPMPQDICMSLIRKKTLAYCNRVQGIIAPSAFIVQDLVQNGCQVITKVLPSGVLPIYFESKIAIKPVKDCFELLTVSRFAKEKTITFLLEMFAKLAQNHKNFKFTLVGYGPEKSYLLNYAYFRLNLLPEQVKFIDKPDTKEQLKQYYQQADLFVFASQAETQGLVLAEAMACGTPVVARYGPGQNDLVVNGQNGYLVHDLNEMVNVVSLIAKNRALHDSLQQGAWLAGKAYDPLFLAQKIVDFYQIFL